MRKATKDIVKIDGGRQQSLGRILTPPSVYDTGILAEGNFPISLVIPWNIHAYTKGISESLKIYLKSL